eukprot:s1860_g3.t1
MGVVLHLVHLCRWHILATFGLALAEARNHLVLRLHKHRASGSFQSRRPLLAELVRQGGSAALGRWRLRVVLTGVLGFVVRGREDGFVVGEGMAPASVGEEGKGPLSLAPSNQASASAARSPSDLVAKGRSLGGGVIASTGRSRLGGVLSYEVELELKSSLLRKNLEAKLNGDDTHKLWELLTDFLDASRDLAALASETWPLKKPPALKPERGFRGFQAFGRRQAYKDAVIRSRNDQEPEGKSAEEKEAYKKRLPQRPEPLIGHYLYRLSTAGWPNKRQKIDDAPDAAKRWHP